MVRGAVGGAVLLSPGLLPHLPGLTEIGARGSALSPRGLARAAVEQLFAGVAAVAQPLG
jgi:hypothetical protein